METVRYEDLYDAERRPGAGVALWTKGVERQLERVREANYRHRLNHSPNQQEHRPDSEAEWKLHCDVYFLALAIRRVLMFHDLFAKQSSDPRLAEIRHAFDQAAPKAKVLRDFLEHLDEYLLDSPRKHRKVPGRAAPIPRSTWGADNVVVQFGNDELDITLAAVAAVQLGRATAEVWDEHLTRALAARPQDDPGDDGVPRMLEVTIGRSTVIGSKVDPPEVSSGTLLDVRVREMTEQERADERDSVSNA
jgi:hypothetical protein